MAGRPPLGLGDWGHISTRSLSTDVCRALALFRDPRTGNYRQVTAQSNTAAKATAALQAKLKLLSAKPRLGGSVLLSGDSTVDELIAAYLVELEGSGLAVASIARYRRTALGKISPEIGGKRLHELGQNTFTALILDEFKKSPSEARLVRAVSKNMCTLAMQNDAMATNHAEGAIGRMKKVDRRSPRALSPDDAMQLFGLLEAALEKARPGPTARKALEDLIDALSLQLAVGARISEVLAIHVSDVDWDGEPAHITIHRAVVYREGSGAKLGPRQFEIPGGYFVQAHTKTQDVRTIALDQFALAILRRRSEDPGHDGLLFHSRGTGKPLSINNLRRTLRSVVAGTDWEWVSTHTMRRSLAVVPSDVVHAAASAVMGALWPREPWGRWVL